MKVGAALFIFTHSHTETYHVEAGTCPHGNHLDRRRPPPRVWERSWSMFCCLPHTAGRRCTGYPHHNTRGTSTGSRRWTRRPDSHTSRRSGKNDPDYSPGLAAGSRTIGRALWTVHSESLGVLMSSVLPSTKVFLCWFLVYVLSKELWFREPVRPLQTLELIKINEHRKKSYKSRRAFKHTPLIILQPVMVSLLSNSFICFEKLSSQYRQFLNVTNLVWKHSKNPLSL